MNRKINSSSKISLSTNKGVTSDSENTVPNPDRNAMWQPVRQSKWLNTLEYSKGEGIEVHQLDRAYVSFGCCPAYSLHYLFLSYSTDTPLGTVLNELREQLWSVNQLICLNVVCIYSVDTYLGFG
jgi:hypothetical protein